MKKILMITICCLTLVLGLSNLYAATMEASDVFDNRAIYNPNSMSSDLVTGEVVMKYSTR